jgi:hypothetical protein
VYKFIKNQYISLSINGFNVKTFILAIRGIPKFIFDLCKYKAKDQGKFPLKLKNLIIALGDRYENAGVANGHYFHQDLWAAKKIYEIKPDTHVDIGSSIIGFISHILVFIQKVIVVDIRPLVSNTSNLVFKMDDATKLSNFSDSSIKSLSSLHAAEHFGLGRYGDPVNPHSYIDFIKSLQRILAEGGRLYFSVPVGRERVEFNSHRVFNPFTITETFDQLELLSFSLIKDDGNVYFNCNLTEAVNQDYACGLFEFTKK